MHTKTFGNVFIATLPTGFGGCCLEKYPTHATARMTTTTTTSNMTVSPMLVLVFYCKCIFQLTRRTPYTTRTTRTTRRVETRVSQTYLVGNHFVSQNCRRRITGIVYHLARVNQSTQLWIIRISKQPETNIRLLRTLRL